jgi:general L-amino acid transport system permease protein
LAHTHTSPHSKPPPWRDQRFLQWLGQLLALGLVGLLIFFLWSNLSRNLRLLGLPIGFDFLNYQAGFSIGETAIDYRPTYSYWRALFVGLVNSLR